MLTERIRNLRDLLLTDLVERDVEVRMVLLAALAGEHALLIGPPGTAKSMIAKRLQLAFKDAGYFERLLTRFTVPEEVFGPYSIPGLEQGRYERLTESYIPTASVAFLDEIFKANSAILNSLLTVLNERKFDNGTQRQTVPLISAIGASNELPEGQELDALYDRFLVRLEVNPASADGFRKLLALTGETALAVDPKLPFSPKELEELREAAETVVTLSAEVEELLCELRKFCIVEEIFVSDRRWRKIVKLLKVSAYTHMQDEVSAWDCWVLQHCLWNTPEQREKLYEWYVQRVGASEVTSYAKVATVVSHLETRLKGDQKAKEQKCDDDGELLYWLGNQQVSESRGVDFILRDGEKTYVAPENATQNGNVLKDRTNRGRGFTREELETLEITDRRYYGRTAFSHWSNREEYLNDEGNYFRSEVDLMPVMISKRYTREHVDARLNDVSSELERVQEHQLVIEGRISGLKKLVGSHIWITPDFLEPALESLQQALGATKAIVSRLEKSHRGFEELPVEEWGGLEEEVVELRPPSRTKSKTSKSRKVKKGGK
jgi:MoxR-like ATPase